MEHKILRASTKFRYGMSDANQLAEWLEDEQPIGIGFIGRSNVGKSSSINALFGNKIAQTSNTPGRTRQINIFEFYLEIDGKECLKTPKFYLFDLPGYGHAKVSKDMSAQWERLMHSFFVGSNKSVLMCNIQDARHPNMKADMDFKKYLEPFKFSTLMVFNKMDKLKNQKERSALNKLKPQIYKDAAWVQDILFISAEKKQGTKELESSIVKHLVSQFEIRSQKT